MTSLAPTTKLYSTAVWRHITAAAKIASKPSYAAVAYFGSTGDKLLPLRKGSKLDTRNNCDFGRLMIRAVFDEVSVGI